jgi:hypothetical protein
MTANRPNKLWRTKQTNKQTNTLLNPFPHTHPCMRYPATRPVTLIITKTEGHHFSPNQPTNQQTLTLQSSLLKIDIHSIIYHYVHKWMFYVSMVSWSLGFKFRQVKVVFLSCSLVKLIQMLVMTIQICTTLHHVWNAIQISVHSLQRHAKWFW